MNDICAINRNYWIKTIASSSEKKCENSGKSAKNPKANLCTLIFIFLFVHVIVNMTAIMELNENEQEKAFLALLCINRNEIHR
jgi:hypothetical protein